MIHCSVHVPLVPCGQLENAFKKMEKHVQVCGPDFDGEEAIRTGHLQVDVVTFNWKVDTSDTLIAQGVPALSPITFPNLFKLCQLNVHRSVFYISILLERRFDWN